MHTNIRLKEATTKATISESLNAKKHDTIATITTLIRVQNKRRLSVSFGKYGFNRFSPIIVAGASMAPLEVLRMAEISAP